jgi:hypothetical protein
MIGGALPLILFTKSLDVRFPAKPIDNLVILARSGSVLICPFDAIDRGSAAESLQFSRKRPLTTTACGDWLGSAHT